MPQIYDVAIDAKREATQQDVDALMRAANAWAGLRAAVRVLIEDEEKVIRGEQIGIAWDEVIKNTRARWESGERW